MAGNEVSSATGTADGELVGRRARVKGVIVTQSTAAGTIVLKDGGSGGTARLTFDAVVGLNNLDSLPGDGILFKTNVYADIDANTDRITVLYQ